MTARRPRGGAAVARGALTLLLAVLLSRLVGCSEEPAGPGPPPTPVPVPGPTAGPPDHHFEDVTRALGIHLTIPPRAGGQDQIIGGLAVADFDNDGRLEILVTHEDERPPEFLVPVGGGYEDRAALWGLDGLRRTSTSLAADFDGDGHEDLVIEQVTGHPRLLLLRNTGTRFVLVTPSPDDALLDAVPALLATDLDGDGRLDLVAAGNSIRGTRGGVECQGIGPISGCPGNVHAYLQVAPLRFAAVPVMAPSRRGQAIRMLDWDEDGRAEVYLAADAGFVSGGDLLLRVDPGPGGHGVVLRDVTAEAGIDVRIAGMGIAPIDVDGDGLDEVLVTNFGRNVLLQRRTRPPRDVASEYRADAYGIVLRGQLPTFRALDPENEFEGPLQRFAEQYIDPTSPAFPTTKWTPAVFDYDEDGIDDVFISAAPTGFDPIFPEAIECSGTLLRGMGRRLADVTTQAGLGRTWGQMAAVAADLDGDLDLDLVLHHPAFRATAGGLSVYRNVGPTGRSLTVVARGRGGMRDGIGAVVEVEVRGRARRKRIDGAMSVFGSGPHEAYFGLGAAGVAERVTVRFPSGRVVRRENVPPGRLVVQEDAAE